MTQVVPEKGPLNGCVCVCVFLAILCKHDVFHKTGSTYCIIALREEDLSHSNREHSKKLVKV